MRRITPGGVVGAAALQQYSGLTGTSFTWSSNITAGECLARQSARTLSNFDYRHLDRSLPD